MSCCQFFLGNPKSFVRTQISPSDIISCKKIQDRFGIRCFSHAPYIYNLCGSKSCLSWNGDAIQDSKTYSVIKNLEYEMDILGQLGGSVVIHPGCYSNRHLGIQTISKTLDKIVFGQNHQLLLENCAGQGDTLASNFKELGQMIGGTVNYKHIGVCIDTAHLWGVGDYDLSSIRGVDKMFVDFDREVGIEKMKLLHLNDSRVTISSRKDQHERIGKGQIWNKDPSSLRYLLDRLDKFEIPFILETCLEDFKEVYKLYLKD
jgi:deoxyribonuclease-4